MIKVSEVVDKTTTRAVYKVTDINDRKAANDFIYKILNSDIFDVKNVKYCDTTRDKDDWDAPMDVRLNPGVTKEEFDEVANTSYYNHATVGFYYNGNYITAGFELYKLDFIIVIGNKDNNIKCDEIAEKIEAL